MQNRTPNAHSSASLLISLMCLWLLLTSSPTANASQFGEGVEGWCIATDPGVGECFQTPLEACKRGWERYVYDPYKLTNPFKGYKSTEFWHMKECDWVTWFEGGNTVVLPGLVDFLCEYGYKYSAPNRCVKERTEERCPSEMSEGTSPVPTGGTNPISLATGSKVEQALDFTTQDNLLQINRQYRSFTSGVPATFATDPLGLGTGWRLSFGYELQINSWYFPYNGYVSVFTPSGGSYDFQKQTSTVLKSVDDDANQVTLKLEFEGKWPSDVADVLDKPSTWKLTLGDGRIVRLKTFIISGRDKEQYTVGRPIEIIHPDGYTQTFIYDDNDALSIIKDSYGRKLTFKWIMREQSIRDSTEKKRWPLAISRIGLPDGNAIAYKYGTFSGEKTDPDAPTPERLEQVSYIT